MTEQPKQAAQSMSHDETHDWGDRIAKLQRPALTTSQPAQAGEVDERAAFEAWYCENVNRAVLPDYLPKLETYSSATVANLFSTWKAGAAWQARASLPAAQQATPEPLHLFEFWWESHMPQATQSQAWAAWTAAQNSKGATIDAAQPATPTQQAAGEPVWEPFPEMPQYPNGTGFCGIRTPKDYERHHLAWVNWASHMHARLRIAQAKAEQAMKELATRPAPGVPDGFTLDQIADACVQAEISDSKFESLGIALAAAQAKGGGHA